MDSNHRTPKGGDLQSPAIATMRPILFVLAEADGIEPPPLVLETNVLPLNQAPDSIKKYHTKNLLSITFLIDFIFFSTLSFDKHHIVINVLNYKQSFFDLV